MRYLSTRGNCPPRTFSEILLEGLAPDGGLYVPEHYPLLDLDELRGATYQMIAYKVLHAFAPEIPGPDLRWIIERTYTDAVFGSSEITPLQSVEFDIHMLQLSNGPTLAFKDVPLQLLGNLMEYELKAENRHLNILGATSGDTGSAAAYALRGKSRMRLFMLSPHKGMSMFQQKQMYTMQDENIFHLSVDGNFDACQAVVKTINADHAFKERYAIGAMNSINWARIAAQAVYWVYAYTRFPKELRGPVTCAVPSGNFGNAFSAYVARKMGVPCRIIVATNENDVLHEFFARGTYRIRSGSDVKITSSPSMDIASASNFERFVFEESNRDAALVQRLWDELSVRGEFGGSFLLSKARDFMCSGVARGDDVTRMIQDFHAYTGIVIDPHTAVGLHVGYRMRRFGSPLIVAETAQPAKFADTIEKAIGVRPEVPSAYKGMFAKMNRATRMKADAHLVKAFIAEHA
jgi:threonine synthase